MIRIKRLWVLPVVLFVVVIYHTFRAAVISTYPITVSDDDGLHWTKRLEKYPVKKFTPLPTGEATPIPQIQYNFATHPESSAAKQTRQQRQAAVKEAFQHSWEGYIHHAWAKDEVAPISGQWRTSFGGWGATLVDTMDTLWIMGLKQDFELCVEAVQAIEWTVTSEKTVNVFETTIRYLGGLLAAYDLSEGRYPQLLTTAQVLAEWLYNAFDTPNRMPVCRWEWRKTVLGEPLIPSDYSLVAELGSLTVEFTRLTELTGDNRYYDAVARIMEALQKTQKSTTLPGLWPTVVNARDLKFTYNHYTLGGMADSTYEYLPKQYLMLGGLDQAYREMYETAIDSAKKYLFFRPMIPSNENILFSGNAALNTTDQTSMLDPQGQHLSCFIGGMLAIGSKIFSRPDDLNIAERLVKGCVWAYNATPSGLMPETFHLIPCHLGVDDPAPGECVWSEDKWYSAVALKGGINSANSAMTPIERGKYWVNQRNILPGFTDHGDNRYILRPEAIESIFILYRITGDPQYQEMAWRMFQAIDKATRTDIAHAAVEDVRMEKPEKQDRMESFWLAETLKYFYLVFEEDTGVVDLDRWVLNTEAHPLRRPREGEKLMAENVADSGEHVTGRELADHYIKAGVF